MKRVSPTLVLFAGVPEGGLRSGSTPCGVVVEGGSVCWAGEVEEAGGSPAALMVEARPAGPGPIDLGSNEVDPAFLRTRCGYFTWNLQWYANDVSLVKTWGQDEHLSSFLLANVLFFFGT